MQTSARTFLWELLILLQLTACAAGSSGRCSLFGRHYVHTFDGVLYGFPGDCSYFLAGDCEHRTFSLLGDFVGGRRTGVTLFLGEAFELRLSSNGLLTQGDKRIPLPYASHSVFAGSELGFYKLWSEEFGFAVTVDNAANVAVTMSDRHRNRTCGLCGNYNGSPADEYAAQEGFLTENSYDFANSWSVNGAEQSCPRVSESKTCNSTKLTPEILSSCRLLQTSRIFQHCGHLVSSESFLSLCEQESCLCEDPEASEDCACAILQEYARSCHSHGLVLKGWQEESQCFPKCPVGMQYSECSRSCSTNCHSLNIQEVCKDDCVDGCICPVGKVLDGSRCVEVSQCSCVHVGRHFPPGSSISQDCNTCVCRHGSWECTNEGCPGECLVVGQSHFKTFDNKFFTFTSQCQYLLTSDCSRHSFSVVIDNVQCADDQGAVCTRSVTLTLPTLDDMAVKLKHGGVVSVNGMDIQTPMHHGRLQILRSVQTSVRVKFGDDLRLDWDGRGRVLLKLDPKWAGQTCGLCGNFNGNQGDDFLSGSGLVESGPQPFGQSWRINGDCESRHRGEVDPCASNPKRVRFAEEACAAILSDAFSPCHFLLSPAPFQRFCRYDVCACTDGDECLCAALSAYAAACAARGVLLHWRAPSLCELRCPEGHVYEACGSPCERTCRALSGAEAGCRGDRLCEEGCFCPAGRYLSEAGECVTADRCSCSHDGQLFQPGDVYADQSTICYCDEGSMRCSSTDAPNVLADLFYDDDLLPSRERRSAPCPPPLIRSDCGSGEKGLECARTCQNLDLPCVSLACISGCLCPPGTVRHRRDCIEPHLCPCYHNNRPYSSGQSISVDCNTCVCENRKWRCTENVCDGVCRTVGEGHYITFDGFIYAFPGLCQYVLVQDACNGEEGGSFRVLLENQACGIVGHRCSKAITVFYQGGTIVLEHGEVRMKNPVLPGSQVEIIRSGGFYSLLLGGHISLSWDRGTGLMVHLSAQYRGRVCGLCGNFDGNVNNDLMGSNNQLEVDPSHFGNSWKVLPSCADVTLSSPPCGDNIVKLVTVEQSCRVLTGPLFKHCNSQVDAGPYVDMCVEAACSCPSVGDCACFCDVIAAYALACSERGAVVSWRSNDLCPMSCEDLNPRISGTEQQLCQWRYNSCGPACPITCQHPEPLECSLSCVEGCHVTCPSGQLLDEVSSRCVDVSQCPVCEHEGQRISHGNRVIFNHERPDLCKICVCENNTLSCEPCPALGPTSSSSPTPSGPFHTMTTPLPFTTQMPAGTCDRAMDLAFLLDGSEALSEDEFQQTKDFIQGVIQRFRMGSAHTRATVLLYHSGVKTYDLQVQKWLFKKTVRELRYSGGDAAFLDEAVKYLVINIYDKNKRPDAGRVAIILTASANPRPVRALVKMLRKKSITTLTVALGPGVNMGQINDITNANPDNRAYVLSSTAELSDRLLELTDHLCTLGMEPEPPKAAVTVAPLGKDHHATTTTTQNPPLQPSAVSTSVPPQVRDVTVILEGSDAVGEQNFNKTLVFLDSVVSQLTERDEYIRITVIQYSVTVTVEISRWELWRERTLLRRRLAQIRWMGGNMTNTGAAVTTALTETVSTQSSHTPSNPQLVFIVTENPPTDTVVRPPYTSTNTWVFPIGVGPNVTETHLLPYSFPQRPVMVTDYSNLTAVVPLVVTGIQREVWPRAPTLPPPVTPSVRCQEPVDVLFLLKSGEHFNDMKTFVKTFVENVHIGVNSTQVGVIQYGDSNKVEFTWREEQSRGHLLQLLDSLQNRGSSGSEPALGSALRFAVQTTVSSGSGGRVTADKVVVFLVTDRSADGVTEAVKQTLAAGVWLFPIGVGVAYDRAELAALGQYGGQDLALHLNNIEQLLMLLSLDPGYLDKICSAHPLVCLDFSGSLRNPGESWLSGDGCHSFLCRTGGEVTVQNHNVSCDLMEPPACVNNVSPVRVQESCSCHWECPCMCMGSSTNHLVRFDGLALRLDREGVCSYSLLTVGGGVDEACEVKLQTGPCASAGGFTQVCMKALEVTHRGHTLLLKDDVTAVLDGEDLALPWRRDGSELLRFDGVMLQLRLRGVFVLMFAPQSNEFTITMLSSTGSASSAGSASTAGLCGGCGAEHLNVLALRNGSAAAERSSFVSDWTVAAEGGVCVPLRRQPCVPAVAMGCQALRQDAFRACHAHLPVQVFLAKCEEEACEESDVCELLAAYARLCRHRGVCVSWRSPHLCPMSCPDSMEYDACRTGCVDDCSSVQSLRGYGAVARGDGAVARGDGASCTDTPTEGCFCPRGTLLLHGSCVPPEACRQCMDPHGHAHQYLQSWVPEENPCLICLCLEQQRINCTARPCNDVRPPVCGPCEILTQDRGAKCCPEYKCVCDPMTCDLPDVPHCEDGQFLQLQNPGECRPLHQCVCKKEACPLQAPPSCPAHRHLSVRKTRCCDVFECTCACVNSTHSCPVGFTTSSVTNDCGCTEVSCLPEKVCVVGGVVHSVGSEWTEGCESCVCSDVKDQVTSLLIAQCSPPVCDHTCPPGSAYSPPSAGGCCGKCSQTSCVEATPDRRGDTGSAGVLRRVGETWSSPRDKCVLHECVRVGDQVFITSGNISCSALDTPSCPLGSELRCDSTDCCPRCHCEPVDGCVLNNTVIGAGERLMVDVCTHCECTVEGGAVRKNRLSCRRTTCPACPTGYSVQKEDDACCGRCVATACFIQRPDGRVTNLQVNSTHEDGCNSYSCGVNAKGDLVLQSRVTTCPPFDRQACLDHGGKIGPIGNTCCEMCTEPQCRRTAGTLSYIRVDDCQSEQEIQMHYCQGQCPSKSMYSVERSSLEQECVCCVAVETEAVIVPVLCSNGTRSLRTVLSVSGCECVSKRCT